MLTQEERIAEIEKRIERNRSEIAAMNTMIANIKDGIGAPKTEQEAVSRGWRAMIGAKEYQAVHAVGKFIVFARTGTPSHYEQLSHQATLEDLSEGRTKYTPHQDGWIGPTR